MLGLSFRFFFFFFNYTATTEIYTLSLHDALPISLLSLLLLPLTSLSGAHGLARMGLCASTEADYGMRSEEHTSELQSRGLISYAVFCLKKKKIIIKKKKKRNNLSRHAQKNIKRSQHIQASLITHDGLGILQTHHTHTKTNHQRALDHSLEAHNISKPADH